MSEKIFLMTETKLREFLSLRHKAVKENTGSAYADLQAFYDTLPIVQENRVPSGRWVNCPLEIPTEAQKEYWNGLSERERKIVIKMSKLGETLAHGYREAVEPVATVIMDSAGGDYSTDYKDIEINQDALAKLPVGAKLYATRERSED